MKFQKKTHKVAGSLAAAAIVLVAAVATATAGPPDRDRPPRNPPPPVASPDPDPQPQAATGDAEAVGDADSEFVRMMIPHHFQATVMGDLATSRAGSDQVRGLAERIEVEQQVEIMMMQNWQQWTGYDRTDAEAAYEMMLGMPMMLEQMGMATPAEMDQLESSSGTDFDRLYLELMIDHHEGAIDMLVDVIINGSDFILQGWATEMLNAQTFQVEQMERMLADLG